MNILSLEGMRDQINLVRRVKGRMMLLDVSTAGDDNVIDERKEANDYVFL